MLGVNGHGAGRAKTVKLHPAGVAQGNGGSGHLRALQLGFHLMQTLDGGVGNFVADIADAVVFGNGKLADIIGDSHLSDTDFEFLKPVAANGPAESHNGGLAHLCFLRQVDNPHVDHLLGVFQHVLRHFHLGFTQGRDGGSNVGQDRTMAHSRVPLQGWPDYKHGRWRRVTNPWCWLKIVHWPGCIDIQPFVRLRAQHEVARYGYFFITRSA